MRYEFTVEQKPTHLHVRVSGENTPPTIAKYLADTREACARLRCPFVLIEEHLVGPPLNTVQIFGVVTEGSKNVWPTVQRVAFVDASPERDRAGNRFAETVAVNRGVNVRVFDTVGEAERWLTERGGNVINESGRSQSKKG